MAKKLTDDEIASIIKDALHKADEVATGKLARERREVLAFYRGEAPGPLHKGDSSYVSRDVFDGVDSMRSQILETFSAHQRIVFFEPERGEHVEASAQATEYCRHVFFAENRGERLMYEALSDGLMNRFSIAKVYVEEIKDEVDFDFNDLDEDELVSFVDGLEDYTFKEMDTDSLAMNIYSGTVTNVKTRKVIKVEIVAPEDFKISSPSCSLRDAEVIAHRVMTTRQKLIDEGYKKSIIDALDAASVVDMEKSSRFDPLGGIHSYSALEDTNEKIELHEVYLKLDLEKRGRSRLYKVVYAGDTVLDKEPVRMAPFCAFVPLPTAHSFLGENYGASLIPTQKARTILQRQIINHAITTNTQRKYVQLGTVPNPSELLDNRKGGIVNVKRIDGIIPEPQAPLNPYVFNMIQMLDEDKEETTGISKLSQGLNKDAISTQNSQGMVEQLINASQVRQKVIARQFGNFICELYWLIYHTAIDYIDEAEFVSVTGQYVPVNPSDWHERKVATVELTLGYGEREKEGQKYLMMDQMFMADPQLQYAYTPDKRWQVLSRITERMGIHDLSTLLTPPDQLPPKEPSEAEKMAMEMQKAQIALQNAQAQSLTIKAQAELIRAQTEQMAKQAELGIKTAAQRLDEAEFAHEQIIDFKELELAEKAPDQRGIYSAG